MPTTPTVDVCSACGATVATDARFCSRCGAEVVRGPRRCRRCDAELDPDARFCSSCGSRVGALGPDRASTGGPAVVAIVALVAAAVLTSIFTDDLVSGTEQSSIPIAVPVSLFWAAMAAVAVTAITRGRMTVWLAGSIAAVAAAITVVSIGAPNLVAGTDPTVVPIGMLTAWLWGAVAIIVLSAVGRHRAGPVAAAAVTAVWTAVVLVSLLVPVVETGSDPTEIPLAAMTAPLVGALVTPLLALVESE